MKSIPRPTRESSTPRRVLGTVAVVGGIILGLSFPPFPLGPAAALGLVALLVVWHYAGSPSAALLYGFLFHGASFAVAFSWALMHEMPSAAVASAVPFLVLPFVLAVPVGLSYIVRRHLGLQWGLVSLVGLLLLAEGMLTVGPLALPWPRLGHTLALTDPVRQAASLVGVSGLSLWLLLVAALTYSALFTGGRKKIVVVGLLALVAGGGWYGSLLLNRDVETEDRVRVAFVQPSMPAAQWADVPSRARVDALARLTDSLLATTGAHPALVVWPETALPPCADDVVCTDVVDRLGEIAASTAPPLLVGAITYGQRRSEDGGPGSYRNSALLLRGGSVVARYDKLRLVPFAEGVPLAQRFPALEALAVPAGGVAGYEPGGARKLLSVDGLSVAPLICFESLFDRQARAYARDGADLLVVLSQNGWWGRSAGYRQHLAFTQLRAIETRLPVVFNAALGSSAAVTPAGTLAMKLDYGERVAVMADVPLARASTFYVRHGELVTPLAAIVVMLLGIAAAVERFRRIGK